MLNCVPIAFDFVRSLVRSFARLSLARLCGFVPLLSRVSQMLPWITNTFGVPTTYMPLSFIVATGGFFLALEVVIEGLMASHIRIWR